MFDYLKEKFSASKLTFLTALKWLVTALILGVVLGFTGAAFCKLMAIVTDFRIANGRIIGLLPLAGLLIIGMYHLFGGEPDSGAALVLSSVRSDDKLKFRVAPLTFAATIITHLFGGSSGREGAALIIGGSIGSTFGDLFRFEDKDKNIMIMCGMSAAFSAIFGTPMAAAVFSIEVITVGIMQYSALLPCVVSSLTAHYIANRFGFYAMDLQVVDIPALALVPVLKIIVFSGLCALASILFCVVMHSADDLYHKWVKNPYLRIFVGGCIVVLLTLLFRTQDYNGVGGSMIAAAFRGETPWFAFLLKLLLTAVTLGAGYKGGDIVPAFFVGATFGSLFAGVAGISPSLCAAVGMGAMFCGITNCPLTSLLICFELFGLEGLPYYMIAIAFSYALSGYYGLYRGQKIAYSKYRTEYINRKTND